MPVIAINDPRTGIDAKFHLKISLADYVKDVGKEGGGGGVAYTAVRGFRVEGEKTAPPKVKDWSWMMLDSHAERLLESAVGIQNSRLDQAMKKGAQTPFEFLDSIERSIANLLSKAVALLAADYADHDYDLKAILFLVLGCDPVHVGEAAATVFAYVDFIKEPFNSTLPINTLIFGSPRSNPTFKDTQWMMDRRYIADRKPETVAEMILHKGPMLYEGMVSNFWVLLPTSSSSTSTSSSDYILQTAPFDVVLAGIISRAIVKVAKAASVTVVYECPDMNDMSKWIGCFTTSKIFTACPFKISNTCKQDALKGISPVKRIEVLESGAYREFSDFNFILQLQCQI